MPTRHTQISLQVTCCDGESRAQTAFDLDEDVFNKNLRSSKKGAAPGPSGMTTDHLRPLLPDHRGLHLILPDQREVGARRSAGGCGEHHQMGRLTALSKPDGRGRVVAGDVVRRLVARTLSQQLSPAVERATSPFQYAMSTRTGCECVVL